MSPKKLTDENKQEILNLYRHTDETTSTLATRYDVSSSTISRFLKNQLSDSEYEELIQQKRLTRNNKTVEESGLQTVEQLELPSVIKTTGKVEKTPSLPETSQVSIEEEIDLFDEDIEKADVIALEAMLGEDLVDLDDDEDDLSDEDDDDWEDEPTLNYSPTIVPKTNIQVLPLSSASFPKTCYLVIDRASELITRPLKEFADLGKIPAEEIQQKTLPVFDNHRIARRFSNRSQRVIKVPDGRMFQKTSSYLEAKGITRLLMDGQVYSVISNQ